MGDILQKHGITFDEARHRYERNGFALPSVTQILPFKCDGPEDAIRKAAERGHRVHKWIEWSEGDDNRYYDEPSIEQADKPYIAAWREFKEITGFELARLPLKEPIFAENVDVPMVERFVYHPGFSIIGKFDVIGYLRRIAGIENDLSLVDAKTGLVSPVTALQTAAYMAAINLDLKKLRLPLVKHRWAAKLLPTGECRRESYFDYRGDLATFLNRLGWVRWAWKHGYEKPERDYFVEPDTTDRSVEEVMARL